MWLGAGVYQAAGPGARRGPMAAPPARGPWPAQTAPRSRSPTSPMRSASRLAKASRRRSEEHTSELQSLMRISYAVFCLKKKNTTQTLSQTVRYQNKVTTDEPVIQQTQVISSAHQRPTQHI